MLIHDRPAETPTTPSAGVCPDCAGPLIHGSGCVTCARCGSGRCG